MRVSWIGFANAIWGDVGHVAVVINPKDSPEVVVVRSNSKEDRLRPNQFQGGNIECMP